MIVKSAIVILLLVFLADTSSFAQAKKKVAKAEATEKFKAYIAEEGYAEHLELEPFDVSRGNRYFKDGWAAFFRYKRSCQNCRHQRVHLFYMDAYGENLTDEHQVVVFAERKRKRRRYR